MVSLGACAPPWYLPVMILVLDNYDSFTYNLVQQLERLAGRAVRVVRNDAFDPEALLREEPEAIVVSPGPGTPARALALATRLPAWLSRPLLARAAGSGRGGKMPSFHIDLHSGRGKSEVEFLHGAVVRAGENFGVPTPVNEVLTETLMALTRGEIPLETFAHQPEKLLALL